MSKQSTHPAICEQVVLLNDAGQPIGTANKSTVHSLDTPLHSAFSIFLFNSQGQMLAQRRAWHKKTWPGIWSNACCGHPMPGEALLPAAERRLSQELGFEQVELSVALPHFRYRAEYQGITENEICPVLIGRCDHEPNINPVEVAEFKWVNWQDFAQAAQDDSDDAAYAHFSPWSRWEALALQHCEQLREIS